MRKCWLLLVLILVLAACKEGKDETPKTDQAPGDAPTPLTPTPRSGFGPTWTPSPEGFIASPVPPTATPTPETEPVITLERTSSLPPTWTPSPTWTPGPPPTQRPSPTRSTTDPSLPTPRPAGPTWTPLPDYCYQLAPAESIQDNLIAGEPFLLEWTPVEGITRYLVEVRHPGGTVFYSETVVGTSHSLPADLFTQADVYGWEVTPLNEAGLKTCFPISGEIVVSFE